MVGQDEGVLDHVESLPEVIFKKKKKKKLSSKNYLQIYLVLLIVHKEILWLLHANVHIQDFQIIYC